MNKKRAICILLSLLMILSALSGCGQKSEVAQSNLGSEVKVNGDEIYPVECADTLTYWMGLNVGLMQKYENFGDAPVGQELERLTGVKVEYIHPQQGQGSEQFNIMLASNDLPDMVSNNWWGYPGGPDAALGEGIILSLNDHMKEWAPNLNKYLEENPDVRKKLASSNGDIFEFPFIRGEKWLVNYYGTIIRKDWLDKAGLDVPESLAEFDEMLNAFKEISGTAPLFYNQKMMPAYIFGTSDNFYLNNEGKIAYGRIEEAYKKSIMKMKDWYDRGILDPDFASIDSKTLSAAVLNDQIGCFAGAVGGNISAYLSATDDPEFDLMGIKQITENGDEIPEFSYTSDPVGYDTNSSISSNCKNLELAMRFLDFGYSEKGHLLYNFGVEGKTYEMVDGEPKFTEFMTNNPDGETFADLSPLYMRSSYNGCFIHDPRYVEASIVYPQQKEAYDNFSITNADKHLMPQLALVGDEIDRAGDIKAAITTYTDEMYIKFVTGREPIENFDKYVKQIYDLGLQELLDIYNVALERYNNK